MNRHRLDAELTALVPVRGGRLPVGARETVAEAGGRCWIVGSGTAEALVELGPVVHARLAELGPFAPGRWTAALAPLLAAGGSLVLPHGPDGRDLAPRLAAALDRPLISGAVQLEATGALVARHGGLAMDVLAFDGPVVATLQLSGHGADDAGPGTDVGPGPEVLVIEPTSLMPPTGGDGGNDDDGGGLPADAVLMVELEADRATMDLADAPRIVAVGAGLGDERELGAVDAVAELLGASVGGTRVVTDWGWMPADRQIGTTGVMVHPRLYLAVGVSGAVQHTAGLGHPAHIIAVNTDPSCPMMELADLALVCDGPAYLRELSAALSDPERTAEY